MNTWEYWTVFGRTLTNQSLNELGRNGWELVSVVHDTTLPLRCDYYFKRLIPAPKEIAP